MQIIVKANNHHRATNSEEKLFEKRQWAGKGLFKNNLTHLKIMDKACAC